MNEDIKLRNTESVCPSCKNGKLAAVETKATFIDYYCPACGAKFDGEPYYNPITKQIWNRGWQRNPEYWGLRNQSLVEKREKDINNTKLYVGTCHLIEKTTLD
jgi:ribosomal protein L37AE/L43A